jgi:hypothetical protein
MKRRSSSFQHSTAIAFFGLAITIIGTSVSATNIAVAQSQAQNPCTLLTTEDVQAIVPKEHVDAGVVSPTATADTAYCRYTWGTGLNRMALDISVYSASRMYSGLTPDAIKQSIVSSVAPDTTDMVITDTGEAAVFRAYSPVYAGATAYLKDRILQVSLDGLDARDRKADLIALLKKAAAKL